MTLKKNKVLTQNYLSKNSVKKSILLTSNHITPKHLGILSSFKKNSIPIVSFQHGVTPEITSFSTFIASTHPVNNVSCFISFNEMSKKVAKEQAYIKCKHTVVGMPSQYYRTNSLIPLPSLKKNFLYLGIALYRGDISNFNGYYTDLEKCKSEIKILKKYYQ